LALRRHFEREVRRRSSSVGESDALLVGFTAVT
jgi:hypothetical protein